MCICKKYIYLTGVCTIVCLPFKIKYYKKRFMNVRRVRGSGYVTDKCRLCEKYIMQSEMNKFLKNLLYYYFYYYFMCVCCCFSHSMSDSPVFMLENMYAENCVSTDIRWLLLWKIIFHCRMLMMNFNVQRARDFLFIFYYDYFPIDDYCCSFFVSF